MRNPLRGRQIGCSRRPMGDRAACHTDTSGASARHTVEVDAVARRQIQEGGGVGHMCDGCAEVQRGGQWQGIAEAWDRVSATAKAGKTGWLRPVAPPEPLHTTTPVHH